MKVLCTFLLLALFSARANASDCKLTSAQLTIFLQQDFNTFDQTDKGWRLYGPGFEFCPLTAAQLIDVYSVDHSNDLKLDQERLLFFHAGQNYSFENMYPIAIRRFERSVDPKERRNTTEHWNAYVAGTIAFLKKDRKGLEQAKNVVSGSVSEKDKVYTTFLNGFIKCFEKPYVEAYSINCQ